MFRQNDGDPPTLPGLDISAALSDELAALTISNDVSSLVTPPTDPQSKSPLFSILPPELRNVIFELALAPYPDSSVLGAVPLTFGFRPETAHPYVQAMELVRTCRRVYEETRTLPVSLHRFVSWALVWSERRPRGVACGPRLELLTSAQLLHIRSLQIYAQQTSLEKENWLNVAVALPPRMSLSLAAALRTLRITIRHTDFWYWEEDRPLALSETGPYGARWRAALTALPMLDEFEMELETLVRRRAELDALVARVRGWQIPLADGRVLSTDGIPLHTHVWDGPTTFCGLVKPPPGQKTLPFYVVIVRWRAPPATMAV